MQYLNKLSLYVKKRRKALGISLNRFCIDNEIDSSCLSKFENQKQQVLTSTLIKIAKGFNQTLAEFLADFEKEIKI
ncbi:MAG: helix-turn-helix transcriptional regulator [Candidatus Gastranaerophilales bacterium]|nr:helix-turn-helix transcriptional regulator [Candidatus Gastranaerophilales bacterium]